MLTSANFSPGAWIYKISYEVGVMFFPEFFNQEYFYIEKEEGIDRKIFPFIYDLPLTPYSSSDEPFFNTE